MRQWFCGSLTACILAALVLPGTASADVLTKMRKGGRILWGGDQEGGGPYVFPKEDNPAQVTGFEVDLANRLGEYLKVKAEFTQGQWDKMPDMLRTGKVHAIINGYEFTPERAEIMNSTIPYYVYALQLMGRGSDATDAGRGPSPGRKCWASTPCGSSYDLPDVGTRDRFNSSEMENAQSTVARIFCSSSAMQRNAPSNFVKSSTHT